MIFILGLLLFLGLGGCQPPPISTLLEGGIDCDVAINMPKRDVAPGDLVHVKARFTNCREVGK